MSEALSIREKAEYNRAMESYEEIRCEMVERQIKKRHIHDPLVLKAMEKVPRHLFVPEEIKSSGYEDNPLSIGFGQTISQPYIVAYMSAALNIHPDHRVLEIGTGSGYQTAVLAELAKEVFSLEIIAELQKRARVVLDQLGYTNIYMKTANGYGGWPSEAPFDRILITAAPSQVPENLFDQLSSAGKMIVPVGENIQKLVLFEKKRGGVIKKTDLIDVRFVPMVDD